MNWWLELWAAPAALGFAVLFNVPPRTLGWACLLAVAGHALRRAMQLAGCDIVLGTLVAALLIGFVAEWWGRRNRQASPVYAVCAAIPMVPGTPMYQAVQALLGIAGADSADVAGQYLISAGVSVVRASMILLALALGIAAPALLWPRRAR
ncbi:threonine/serine exporter family protein [Chitiniphilus purpureus]|uniref:Threonine/serine exporter family protein n=1 Tax=Chitiniphilus purpureus TaxID=2981137 RepID=A0ABY6DNX6_9NEIS|nr:threonine/serine exporter family protein [Chitiniphilus sp. CD1]UXY15918.1 threonine/serine exporter family protein [Chitiniphilus sp. CD1]